MDDLSDLATDQFQIVIHPVSTCYVPDVAPVYREVARVLKIGGTYISQHKQPTSLQAAVDPRDGKFQLEHPYYLETPLEPVVKPNLVREKGTMEYVHRWEQLIGEMCGAGFVIEALLEPRHALAEADPGSFEYRSQFLAPYVRAKARLIRREADTAAKVWVPI